MQPIVEARGITKRFGSTTALLDANISIKSGSIHALVGRNGAGKSTLVGILTGLVRPDRGSVQFGGEPAPALGDRDGWRRNVACVYQHSMIVPHLSVAENIFLNRQPRGALGAIDWQRMYRSAKTLLAEWNLTIDERASGDSLSVEERQLVEIVRALSFGTRFIILDEPTARLEGTAIARLFQRLRSLNAAGVTILFISHHLQEVYELCDTVTVLRDGHIVQTSQVDTLSQEQLIKAMTGEALAVRQAFPRKSALEFAQAGVVIDVDALSGNVFEQVSLRVRAGEMLGVAGIGGSGKTALAEAIAGLQPARGGTIRINGILLQNGVRAALLAGIGFIPRDRHREGFIPDLSIAENATLTIDDRFGIAGWIDPRKRAAVGAVALKQLGIVADDAEKPVRELSGGNQQKVVFARALARDPKVLVAIDPTAGIDVASKETLRSELISLRGKGLATLIVTDDLDDLHACDRVVVLFNGRIVAELPAGWSDHELVAWMEGLAVA